MKKPKEESLLIVKRERKKYKLFIILGSVLLLLIILRMFLPIIVLKYVNRQLKELKAYTGKVEDIDIRLYRGAYIIDSLVINKIDTTVRTEDTIPFLSFPKIDFSLDWGSILKGSIKGKIILKQPVIKYTNEFKDEDMSQDTADFQDLLKSLMPLTVNRFEIHNGSIHYIDLNTQPAMDIGLTNLYIVARNMSNVVNKQELLPAKVKVMANMYDGQFQLDMSLNPLKKQPTFELETELKNMDMIALNEFFKTYGNFEVEKGQFNLYAEFAGKEGGFGGYIKPFITDFEIKKYTENDELKQKIWEMIVGTAMKILENPKTDKVATKIPMSGQFSDPDINTWKAVHYVLRNAFVQALRPTIENTINVHKLEDDAKETLLEKVFGDGDKKNQKAERNSN